MAWPTEGEEGGWEEFGEPIDSLPIRYELPLPVKSYYYDPSRLNGLGLAQEALTLLFNESTVTVRRRVSTVEAEFIQTLIWGDALLDRFVVPEIGAACTLVLEVFEDDRDTVRWAVGTSPNHAAPYLVEPDSYAEQEVDVANGAATLGTVTVTVIDPSTVPGNQDRGWFTAKLSSDGIPDIRGRRARLKRFISEELGFYVIADGPAGSPRLDSSYAAFTFDIRDTRETERKFKIFDGGWGGDRTDPLGARTLLPDGIYGGYGFTGSSYLIDPAEPLLGRVTGPGLPGPTGGLDIFTTRIVDLTATPGNAIALRKLRHAAAEAGIGYLELVGAEFESGGTTYQDYVTRFPDLALLWREQGDSVWQLIEGENLQLSGRSSVSGVGLDSAVGNLLTHQAWPSVPAETHREVTEISFSHRLYVPIVAEDYLPAFTLDIELILVYLGPPSEGLPAYVEGLTAGEFTRNVYAGFYAKRDQDGNQVPTGIRYVEADLLQMTDPVRIRVTEPIKDARDWLEKHVYAPTGWAPALNDQGEISPVSQVAPLTVNGLLPLSNAITEPSPNWNAGERIINLLRFTYIRDYLPDDDPSQLNQELVRPGLAGGIVGVLRRRTVRDIAGPDGDGIAQREVIVEFIDPVSVDRNGEQVLEIDALAFRAIGQPNAEPLGDEIEAEQGHQMAVLRQLHVHNRYSLGAPIMSVAVMRAPTLALRAGSWVAIDLSWFPDYVTRFRGLVALGQIIAIGELDCKWRQVTMEVVVPLVEPGS